MLTQDVYSGRLRTMVLMCYVRSVEVSVLEKQNLPYKLPANVQTDELVWVRACEIEGAECTCTGCTLRVYIHLDMITYLSTCTVCYDVHVLM